MACCEDALLEDPNDRIPAILDLDNKTLTAKEGTATRLFIEQTLAAGRPCVIYGCKPSQMIELTESSFSCLRRDLDSMIEVQGELRLIFPSAEYSVSIFIHRRIGSLQQHDGDSTSTQIIKG